MSVTNSNAPSRWPGDYLRRQIEADYLTQYLTARYEAKKEEQGFVLAVNGDWGIGKSFMIDRWGKDLENAGHPIVMFNSWENDFTEEPLVAFIAELNSALVTYFDRLPLGPQLRKKWLAKAKAVLVPSLKVVGMAALKQFAGIGVHEVKDLIGAMDASSDDKDDDDENSDVRSEEKVRLDTKELSERLTKVVEEELKSHTNVKSAISDFKLRLSELVKYLKEEAGIQLPIFVFVDELDRCRPDYAIKLLEGIKHLFGIPGIHFIVATNLSELAHSVRAVYGEQFSGERYLKRFFDMEYSLPEPKGIDFASELMVPIIALSNATFVTGLDQQMRPDEFPAKNLSYIFLRYAITFGLTLRDQQQAAKVLEASLLTLGNVPVHIHFLFFLISMYQKNTQVYRDVTKGINLAEYTGFEKIVPGMGSKPGSFQVMDPTNDDRKYVSIRAIVEVYFSIISGNHQSANNSFDFPNNLGLNLRNVQQGPELLRRYIEIVRRAGQFSE